MDGQRLHTRLLEHLRALRRPDGGFPSSVGGRSEIEPTAVAALALHDAPSVDWLRSRQASDGSFEGRHAVIGGTSVAALAALVLTDPPAARRALAFAIENRGLPLPNAADLDRRVAWGWTSDARSLVEPTARVLLAVNALTPADRTTREEALSLLTERQCDDGGWNYGNASVYDVDLRGYAQTTAIALIALQDGPQALVGPGLRFLGRQWEAEPGGLTAAQALVAFRLHRHERAAAAARTSIATMASRRSFLERPLAVAWAAVATAPDESLEPLRSRA